MRDLTYKQGCKLLEKLRIDFHKESNKLQKEYNQKVNNNLKEWHKKIKVIANRIKFRIESLNEKGVKP